MAEEYTLEDLEKLSGLPIRTLRFYIQEGLLPGPDTRGKFARYSGKHLSILEFIQRLKTMHLPLQQIRRLLDSMTSEELSDVLRTPDFYTPARNLNFVSAEIQGGFEKSMPAPIEDKSSPQNFYLRSTFRETPPQKVYSSAPVQPPPAVRGPLQKSPRQEEETWQRIQLAEGMELQVRKPLDRDTSLLVDELRRLAHRFFDDLRRKNENGEQQDY